MGMLQWMLNKEKGIVRLTLGDWALLPGNMSDMQKPWWIPLISKFSEADLLKLEQPTRLCNVSFIGRPPFTVAQLEDQVSQLTRPALKDVVDGFWAASHLEGFHWERRVRTWGLPSLISSHGHSHTLKQIWEWWTAAPAISKSKTKGSNITRPARSLARRNDYLETKERTDKLLKEVGLEPPSNVSDYRAMIRKVGLCLRREPYYRGRPWL